MANVASATGPAADTSGDESYFEQLPIVLTPSRLPQSQREAPAAVTVLDQSLIHATGYRDIARLLRLVPGMQVGQERAGSNWVTYHGLGNDTPFDMQVLVDGRAIYSPGIFSGVDWHALPVTLEEIDRIEVVRGTNAAAYGPNAFMGVINIITRHSSDAPGAQASINAGSPGLRDVHADWAGGADGNTARFSFTSRQDDGYQGLYDSNRVDILSVRSDHRLSNADEVTLRLAGSQAKRGTGYADSLYSNNPERVWHSENMVFQAQWRHAPSQTEELLVNFFRVQDRYRDSWTALGPRPDLTPPRVDPIPVGQDRTSLRHSLEVQHRFAPTATTQLVWGAELSSESLEAPQVFYTFDRLSDRLAHVFANLEWRFAHNWIVNAGGMIEKYSNEQAHFSPRLFLNWQATPDSTLRTGYARAWRERNDLQSYADIRAIDPTDGRVLVHPYLPNPDLRRPRVDSFEFGYLTRFRPANTTLDVRVFREEIHDFVLRVGQPPPPDNPLLASVMPSTQYINLTSPVTLVGLEYQVKARPFSGAQIIFNHALIDRRTDNDIVSGRAAPYSASLSWLQDWGGGWSSMVSVIGIGPLAGGDGYVPRYQYSAAGYTTADLRIAKRVAMGREEVEFALSGINLGGRHQEIANRSEQALHPEGPANLVSPMVFFSVGISYR